MELNCSFQGTILHLVPPLVLFLAKHPLVQKYEYPALREMVIAAAPLSVDVANEAKDKLRQQHLLVRQGTWLLIVSNSNTVLV